MALARFILGALLCVSVSLRAMEVDRVGHGDGAVARMVAVRVMDLRGKMITDEGLLSVSIPQGVTEIDLSGNKLTVFPADFIQRLPVSVGSVNLSDNQIDDEGADFSVAQRGLRINIAGNFLTPEKIKIIHERLTRPNLTLNLVQNFKQYMESPWSLLAKMTVGAAACAGYIFMKKYFTVNPQSGFSRMIKFLQNGLYITGAVGSLKLLSVEDAVHKLVMFLGATTILGLDMCALTSGAGIHGAITNRFGAVCVHGATASLRAVGLLSAVSRVISWGNNRVTRSCDVYIKTRTNRLLERSKN